MPANLTKIYDHPAEVLLHKANVTGMVGLTASNALRVYEKENGVTFAALNDTALTAVSEAYDAFDGRNDRSILADNLLALRRAISGLLGLDD